MSRRRMRLAGGLWLLVLGAGCGTENPNASAPRSAEVSPPSQSAASATSETQSSGSVLDDLVEAFRQRRPEQWTEAESAIHAQGAEALPMLWEGLASPDRQTRELAAMMLAQVLPGLLYAEETSHRPDPNLIAEKLHQSLSDESVEVRVNVAVALSLIPGEGPRLVPVFEELLRSDRPHIRTMAVAALGGLGSLAAGAVPEIKRLSETDGDPAVQSAALEALGQMKTLR